MSMRATIHARSPRSIAFLFAAVWVFFSGSLSTTNAQSAQSSGPAPVCALAANAGNDIEAFQGSPLILDATLYHPLQSSTSTLLVPLIINAQNGSWANTIQLRVTDASGATQNWPIQLVSPPSGSLTLDETNEGDLTWIVGPSATAVIPPGTYTAVVTVDTTSSAGTIGWNGIITSDSVSVQIGPPPSPLADDQQSEQVQLLAMYDHLSGNDAQAISDLQSYLASQPADVTALELEGKLFEAMGQPDSALDAYDDAVGAFFVSSSGAIPEPPSDLTIPQGVLRSNLFSQTGEGGTAQVSIQIAGQGTQASGVSFIDLQVTNVGTGVAENILLGGFVLQVLNGTGQAMFDNVHSPRLPIATDSLDASGSTTERIFVATQGTVNSISLTESGTVVDIFGTSAPFTQTQTVSLNSTGGGGGTPASLTITAPNATQVYGQAPASLNNVTYSGFVNGDGPASLSGALTCVTTATQSGPVSTYPITCSGLTSPNYTITFVPGTLSVTPAPLTITANSAARQFGQPNPAFSASFGGFVNGDTVSSLTGALSCNTTATPASSVSDSPYPIVCSGLSSTNYSISFVAGLLTITKATPAITWANLADVTQGTALGAAQLNATASVPGSFTYTPSVGTILSVGPGQMLSVTFIPSDGADYNSASASVLINVNGRAPVPGDLNGDGVVDCNDLNIIKASFGKKAGQAGFDPRADINGDGIVNVIDLSAEAKLVPAGTVCK
jgi:MBG domain (YGX type)/Dockerin type I domain